MRSVPRYVLTILLGLAIGIGAAVHVVRAGAFASNIAIGPWRTGRDFGTAAAGAKTRAVVALSGLLALPAHEARYYTAETDDAGSPLDGHCRYRVTGGPLPARWWSLTLYDQDGYLAGSGPYSVESAQVDQHETTIPASVVQAAPVVAPPPVQPSWWSVNVGPQASGTRRLGTSNLSHFQLTLRLYLPQGDGQSDPPARVMPSIVKEGC